MSRCGAWSVGKKPKDPPPFLQVNIGDEYNIQTKGSKTELNKEGFQKSQLLAGNVTVLFLFPVRLLFLLEML